MVTIWDIEGIRKPQASLETERKGTLFYRGKEKVERAVINRGP